jgi:N-acetyl-anhydromuramyl-L-alanine amidase AmpD
MGGPTRLGGSPMGNPTDYHFVLPESGRPGFVPLAEQLHGSFHWLTANRSRRRPVDPIDGVDTIIIHGTDGSSTASAVATWRQPDSVASAHWIVPDEDESEHGAFAWATVAESKAAQHCRTTGPARDLLGPHAGVNSRSLGIEVVNRITGPSSDPYSDWQVTMTARIVLYAWAKYPNLHHVVSHAKLDPTRRSDPGSLFPWDSFQDQVLSHSALPA